MQKVEIDYSEIDEGIRDLIYNLNQLSFLNTFYSCEGHLLDRWPNPNSKYGSKHSVELVFPKMKFPTTPITPAPINKMVEIPTVFPDQGHKFIANGSLVFHVQLEEPLARLFLHDLLGLESDYSFMVSYRRLQAVYVGYDPKGNRGIILNAFDLTPGKVDNFLAIQSLPLEEQVKISHQVKLEEGEKRILEFKRAWHDLLLIAKGYIQ